MSSWFEGLSIRTKVILLEGLARAAAAVAAGDSSMRAGDGGPAEIVRVAQQFKRMLDAPDRAEAALRASESNFRNLVECSPGALCVHRAGRLVYVNPAAVSLFGAASAADLVGKPIVDLIRRDVHPIVAERIGAPIEHRTDASMAEQILVRLDGTLIDVEVHAQAVPFDGEPSLLASIRDITVRKRAAAELRESEAVLRRLLERLPEAVVAIRDGGIVFVNAAAEHLLGAAAVDLVARPAFEIFGPGSVVVDPSRLLALQASGAAPPLIEERIVRADGAVRVVECTATRVKDRRGTSTIAVLRDVTELKRAQAALVDSHADLQRLLAAQDTVQEEERRRIARELHDDLQQTLAVIRIDLGVIVRRLGHAPAPVAALVAAVDAHVAALIASTRRIVNDLRPQMLEDLGLEAALQVMADQLGERAGMDCRVEAQHAACEALLRAPAVTTCLFRVAQEALNNVRKHAQASTVRIELTLVAYGRVALSIHDNGRGFDARERHGKDSFGLRSMAERVRAIGGVLRIDSSAGQGTRVEVIVPSIVMTTARKRAADGSPERAPDGDIGQRTIDGKPGAHPLQGVVDALAGHVAVLDANGVIECVNRAWRDFAERNGAPGMSNCGPGSDYLAVCRRSALSERDALPVLQGLSAVLDGTRTSFVSEYPCDAPDEQRWFRLHAAPMAGGRVLVTHFELTEWVDRSEPEATH